MASHLSYEMKMSWPLLSWMKMNTNGKAERAELMS